MYTVRSFMFTPSVAAVMVAPCQANMSFAFVVPTPFVGDSSWTTRTDC